MEAYENIGQSTEAAAPLSPQPEEAPPVPAAAGTAALDLFQQGAAAAANELADKRAARAAMAEKLTALDADIAKLEKLAAFSLKSLNGGSEVRTRTAAPAPAAEAGDRAPKGQQLERILALLGDGTARAPIEIKKALDAAHGTDYSMPSIYNNLKNAQDKKLVHRTKEGAYLLGAKKGPAPGKAAGGAKKKTRKRKAKA